MPISLCRNLACGNIWTHPETGPSVHCPVCHQPCQAGPIPDAQVVFTAEGGYRYNGSGPNPYVPPPEPQMVHWNSSQLSVEYDRGGWGHDIVSFRAWVTGAGFQPNSFTSVDRGSLLRIATAAERTATAAERSDARLRNIETAIGTLSTLLHAALRPALALAHDAQDRLWRLVRARFEELLEPLVRSHGPCPQNVKSDLWDRFDSQGLVGEAIKNGYLLNKNGFILDLESFFDVSRLELVLPRKRTKERREYDRWLEV